VIFVDDCSTDTTFGLAELLVGHDERFKLFCNEENKTKSWNFCNLISDYVFDNDILLFLDGDDWLATNDVLKQVNDYFRQFNPWVVYGGMVVWEGDSDNVLEPNPQNSLAPQEVVTQRLFRKDMWRYSHLKAMRGFLWNNINKENFVSSQDGKYIKGGDDLVIMFDALEKCPPSKIGRFDFPTYVYNASDSQRISDHMHERGVNYEAEIRSRPLEKPLRYITTEFSGGLGNMMFQAAGVASLAHKNGLVFLADLNTHNLPNQGKNVRTYVDNVFRNIPFDSNVPVVSGQAIDTFNTATYVVEENSKILGSFVGEKWFDKNLIRKLFCIPHTLEDYIVEKYPDIRKRTSIHVRHGDYHKFPEHHPILSMEYYNSAIKKIGGKFIVFSDDVEWCKQNIKCQDIIYSNEADYVELYMMSLCENNIIANSTFSWWGAWLNENPNKRVIAPKTWFGPKYNFDQSDIVPKEWERI
jgi:glycosyltransferase involved in cell wall biosynthesis